MTSQHNKFLKKLEDRSLIEKNARHPEDAQLPKRAPDKSLYSFLDKLTEDYSWRENILNDDMTVHLFRHAVSWDEYEVTSHEQQTYDMYRWLELNKCLSLANNHNGTITIRKLDDNKIYELMKTLRYRPVPANVVFTPSSGEVIFNGTKHKLQNGNNLKIFRLLASKQNERITKKRIWSEIKYTRKSGKADIASFGRLIANVRTSVGASVDEIILDNTVTLNATVKIID